MLSLNEPVIEGTWRSAEDGETPGEMTPELGGDDESELSLVDEYITMDVDDFKRLKALDRDVVLFVLLRDLAGEIRSAVDAGTRVFDKGEELIGKLQTPEGMKELTDGLMGSLMGGGMFGIGGH